MITPRNKEIATMVVVYDDCPECGQQARADRQRDPYGRLVLWCHDCGKPFIRGNFYDAWYPLPFSEDTDAAFEEVPFGFQAVLR